MTVDDQTNIFEQCRDLMKRLKIENQELSRPMAELLRRDKQVHLKQWLETHFTVKSLEKLALKLTDSNSVDHGSSIYSG